MKNYTLVVLVILCSVFVKLNAQTNGMNSKAFNFTSFNSRQVHITPLLLSLTPADYQNHPDFGILPAYAPKGDYIELIHKRTDSTRMYVSASSPKDIAIQKGYGPINFRDSANQLREIDFELHPTATAGVYKTSSQPHVITIDANQKQMNINVGGTLFTFSKNLKLWYEDVNGLQSLVSTADWTHFTVGANGFYITDLFPNVDFYGVVNENQLKTNFKIKSNITSIYPNGYLVISDEVSSELTTQYIPSVIPDSQHKFVGDLQVINTSGANFTVHEGVCFDNIRASNQSLFYRKTNAGMDMLVDLNWLNTASLQYPVTVDPTISTSGSLAQASCSQSRYNGSCNFTNSCDYLLTVATPANTTITDLQWTFTYFANGTACYLQDGAIKIAYGACISPAASGYYWFCNAIGGGNCAGTNVSMWSDLSTCVPAPACTPYNMTFTLKFYRSCWGAAGCAAGCINSASPWTMTILGKTMETLGNTVTGNGTSNLSAPCNSTQLMNPTPANGVGPYTYLWSPGGQTTSTNTIPTFYLGTQTYSCTVTDACGVARTAVFNVSTGCVLPVELLNFYGNVNRKQVDLFWQTASETNSSHFTIERSYDGINFVQIGTIKAAGNSLEKQSYTFNDVNADLDNIIYYRLKQYDIGSNKERFSSLIDVEAVVEKSIDVFPNPGDGLYEILPGGAYAAMPYDVSVYDYMGKEILKRSGMEERMALHLENYPAGIYMVKITINNKVIHKNIVKQ